MSTLVSKIRDNWNQEYKSYSEFTTRFIKHAALGALIGASSSLWGALIKTASFGPPLLFGGVMGAISSPIINSTYHVLTSKDSSEAFVVSCIFGTMIGISGGLSTLILLRETIGPLSLLLPVFWVSQVESSIIQYEISERPEIQSTETRQLA